MAAPEIVDVEVTQDQQRINTAMVTMHSMAQQDQQDAMAGVFSLGKAVGSVLTAKVLGNFCAVAQIHAFREINESKAFKHLQIQLPDGSCAAAQNIDEFCRYYFGVGYRAMSDHKLMMDRLGEETYENANRLGLNRSQLRLLINLPKETRADVEEAMREGNKAKTETLILSLANQLDEARAKTEELKANITAKEEVLTRRAKQVDALEEKLSRVQKMPPDEVALELQAAVTRMMNDTLGALRGQFAYCLRALDAHDREHGPGKNLAFMAGAVGTVQAELDAIRDDLSIPDVLPSLIPEWVTDPNFKNFAAS